jgi:hypothetical protein
VTAVANNQVTLAWNDNSADETGFELRWSRSGTGGWTTIALGANTTSHPHSGLTAGTSYYYQVRAVNGAGTPSFAPATPVLGRTTGGSTSGSGFTPPPGLKEAYCYPNPAVGRDPVIRAMMGTVDSVEVTIFDQAGKAVHSGRATNSVNVNGETAYEYPWTGEKATGIYYAVIHGKKGDQTVRARAKFAVIR